MEGINAPEAEALVHPDPDVDAAAVEETVQAFEEHPGWRSKLTAEGRKALKLIERYSSEGVPEGQAGEVGAALAQLQIEMRRLRRRARVRPPCWATSQFLHCKSLGSSAKLDEKAKLGKRVT